MVTNILLFCEYTDLDISSFQNHKIIILFCSTFFSTDFFQCLVIEGIKYMIRNIFCFRLLDVHFIFSLLIYCFAQLQQPSIQILSSLCVCCHINTCIIIVLFFTLWPSSLKAHDGPSSQRATVHYWSLEGSFTKFVCFMLINNPKWLQLQDTSSFFFSVKESLHGLNSFAKIMFLFWLEFKWQPQYLLFTAMYLLT